MLLLQINNDLIFNPPNCRLAARRIGVNILAHFVDLATQITALIRRQAANAAVHLGVAAGFLHRAALFFGTGLVAVARIDLTLLVGLARIGLALILDLLRPVFLAAWSVAGIGIGQPRPHQTAAQQ